MSGEDMMLGDGPSEDDTATGLYKSEMKANDYDENVRGAGIMHGHAVDSSTSSRYKAPLTPFLHLYVSFLNLD